jgi:secondary thiamine-phosphate synthase enzyme
VYVGQFQVADRATGGRSQKSSYFMGMKVHQGRVSVSTRGRGLHDITGQIGAVVREAGITTGLCTVFVQHTSASLVIQENADPSVQRDLERWIARVCPDGTSASYEHDAEGPDDMPSHLRSAMTRTSEVVPVTSGRLALGTWQAIYLWEHRTSRHMRSVVVHIQGM